MTEEFKLYHATVQRQRKLYIIELQKFKDLIDVVLAKHPPNECAHCDNLISDKAQRHSILLRGKLATYCSSLCRWNSANKRKRTKSHGSSQTFSLTQRGRQALEDGAGE